MSDVGYSKRPGQKKDFQLRLLFFIIFTISSFFLLIIVIGNIQIIKNLKYSDRSTKIREKVVRIPPIRGKIYSADEQLLANNETSFNVYITPKELYKDKTLRQKELLYLSEVINIKYSDIENILKERRSKREEILIKDNISFNKFTRIKENQDNMPGITVKESLYRIYPNMSILSHVLGYTGPINPNELAIKLKKGYQRIDHIGKNGIEKYYENLLRGIPGRKVYSIDARMIIQKEIKEKEIKPEPGKELVLSINLELQKNIEDILADRMGTILVMNPSNGEILAMTSYPDFDPNIYTLQSEENSITKRQISLNTRGTPLINRNIQSVYPPASVFKMVTATAIMNENIIPIEKTYYCSGKFRMNTEYFKCWVHPNNHGNQNLIDGLKNSCDIYFYNVGLKAGPEKIQQYALSFGFGNVLGIDLPFEKSGLVPSVEWMKNNGKTWHYGHTLNTTIGQGDVKATPIQIANFMSIICNKGYSFRPHILKEIRSSVDGSIVESIKPEKIINLTDYDPYLFMILHRALRKVVTEGTALGGFYSNKLQIAGKTGTAEIGMGSIKQTHSWFAGFGPLDYPLEEQIVVVVLIEYENNNFLKYAAPIASMVFNSWIKKENFYDSARRLMYPIKSTYNEEIKSE